MERELEKILMEIECAIKNNEQRGNTHTQSVLEQAQEIVEMCAQAAQTPSELNEILERDTAKTPVQYGDEDEPILRCPHCNEDVTDLIECGFNFCPYCGGRWEG